MATSQYTILRQYTPYVSPYNIDLIKDVMVYKQGQVDANRERINQQVDYLMGQQIDKPEAREYMETRMANTMARINDMYRGADLSSEGVARHIQSEISTVLDSTVINAIAGTKEGRRMQQYLNDLAINNKEIYSDANAYVAMLPYYEWLNDGQAGSRLGSLHYTPYTDYNKELADVMKEIRSTAAKGHKYTFPLYDDNNNPTGAMIEYESNAITPEQAASYAYSTMSQNARNQMQIDAMYMSQMSPEQFSYQNFAGYMLGQVNQVNEYIGSLRAELEGVGGNMHRKQELQSEINRAKGTLVELKSALENVTPETYTPYQGALMVTQRNFLNGAAARWSYDNSSTEVKEDPMYWKRLNYDLKVAEFNAAQEKAARDAVYQEEMLKIRRMEAERKAREAKGESSSSGSGSSSTQGISPQISSVVVSEANTDDSSVDFAAVNNEKYNEISTARTEAYNRIINNLPEQYLYNINSYISKKRSDPNSGYAGLSDIDAFIKYVKDNAGLQNTIFTAAVDEGRVEGQPNHNDNIRNWNELVKRQDEFISANRRINELNAVTDSSLSPAWDRMVGDNGYFGRFGKYKGAYGKGMSDEDFANDAYVFDALYRAGVATGHFDNIEKGKISASTLSAMQKDLNSINRIYNSRNNTGVGDISVWDYVVRSDDGTYSISASNDSPAVIKSLYKAVNQINPGVFKDYSNLVSYYLDKEGLDDRRREVEKKYYSVDISPSRVFPADMTRKDLEYGMMNSLKSLYEAKRNKVPLRSNGTTPASILSYAISRNSDGSYTITAIDDSPKEDTFALISAAELMAAGVNVGDVFGRVSPGGYNSGMRSVVFADPNNVDYESIMQQNGLAKYSTKNRALTSLVEVANSAIDSSIYEDSSRGITSETISGYKRDLEAVIRTILDNSGKFMVQFKGFDQSNSQSVGYDAYVWLQNQSNKEGKPTMIIRMRNENVPYMDSEAEIINMAPQFIFSSILREAIENEIQNLKNLGQYDMDGNLMNLYRAAGGAITDAE